MLLKDKYRDKNCKSLLLRTSAILKYFCPLICAFILVGAGALIWLNRVDYARKLKEYNIGYMNVGPDIDF